MVSPVPSLFLPSILPFLLGVLSSDSVLQASAESNAISKGKLQRGGDSSQFTSHFHAATLINQSSCFKRIPIPHFRAKDYALPGTVFEEGECRKDDAKNQIRTTLQEEFGGNEFRLPKTLSPTHYLVKLCPEVGEPFNFTGSVEIELRVNEPTDKIVLNMVDLEIQSVSLTHFTSGEASMENYFPKISRSSKRIVGKARRKNSKFQDFRVFHSQDNKSAGGQREFPPSELLPKRENTFHYSEFLREEAPIGVYVLSMDEKLQTMTLMSDDVLALNSTYKLKMSFTGTTNAELIGLYRLFHYDNHGRRRNSLVTQFQVSEARKTFPCFDEPGFRSSFTLILCRDKALRTISNMPKIATVQKKDDPGRVWDLFRTSVPMATYLLAFAILDDYDYVDCNHTFIPFKVWAPHPHIHMTKFACDVGPSLLDFFETYFNLPYPLPKMDMIALPQFFAYGMENWGLVTFIMDRLLTDFDAPDTLKTQQNVLETISHEMSHQWFGNLVTPSWWSDIWLNEGFATFLSLLGFEYIRPSWLKLKEYVIKVLHAVLINDSVESSHSIVMNVTHPRDYFTIFDEISYGKGCFIVRMMMHILTEKVFQEGLQTYLKEMQFKSAAQSDLWHFLTLVGHNGKTLWKNLTISEIMDTWLLQKGYPVVSAFRMEDGNLATAQNKHFLEIDEEELLGEYHRASGTEPPKWWIPLSIATKQNPNMLDTSPKFWMHSYTHIFYLSTSLNPDDWFVLNMQQTGYFRVNYDRTNWLLLTYQLMEDHTVFDDITRAQLIDDSFSLAYSEKLDYDVPLSMISYLSKEESPYVISAALENLRPLLEVYAHDALYGELKDYLQSLFSGHFPTNGILRPATEPPFEKETNIKLIKTLCPFYKPCIEESRQIFYEWTLNPTNVSTIDNELIETILCITVAEGGEEEWQMIWTVLQLNMFEDLHQHLLYALSCSRHLWLNNRLLMVLSMDKSSILTKFYLPMGLNYVAKNPISVGLAWEYLQVIWPTMVGTISEQLYFEAVVPNLRSETQLSDLIRFVSSPTMMKTSLHKTYIEEMVRNVNRKVQFQVRNYDELFLFFATNKSHSFSHSQDTYAHNNPYDEFVFGAERPY